MVRGFFSATIIFVCFATASEAENCDAVTARIVGGVAGTTFVRKVEANDTVELKHQNAMSFAVFCGYPAGEAGSGKQEIPDAVNLAWDGAFAPAKFFDLVGKAGSALTGASSASITDGAKRCQKVALETDGKAATVTTNGVAYECDASSLFNVTVNKEPANAP